jgi:hypothetical protein
MKGVVSEQTRRKGDIVTNSKEALKKRADARFKKDERVREGTKAMLEYEAEGRAHANMPNQSKRTCLGSPYDSDRAEQKKPRRLGRIYMRLHYRGCIGTLQVNFL